MTIWFEGADDIRLAADSYGPIDGPPVVMLGGLGQTRHSWRRTAEQIAAEGWRALTLDLRGHGESHWAPDGDYSYSRLVADLIAVVRQIGQPAVLVGASLGGKVSLAAAGYAGPTIARALALADTAPRTVPSGVRDTVARLHAPAGFASPQEAAESLARQRGVAVAAGAAERLRRNMRSDETGRWYWHWDPLIMDRDHGLGMMPALAFLEEAARRITRPVLLCRGELSDVTSEEGVQAFVDLAPQTVVEVIRGAGHMIVGDQNDAFASALLRFLAVLPPR